MIRLRNQIFLRFGFLILLVGQFVGCSSLLYHPTNRVYYDPKKFNLESTEVEISLDEKIKLHGLHFPAQGEEKGAVLFFHGNGENLSSHFIMLSWLPENGYSYFIFDYPGYGKSTGSPNPENVVQAGLKAFEWLREKTKKPVFIFGHSLGGNIALRTAEELKKQSKDFKGVVVDGTFLSFRSIGKNILSRSWVTWLFQPLAYLLLSDRMAPEDPSSLAPTPILVLHGVRDPVIPLKFGEEVFAKAAEPKSFSRLEGVGHGNAFFVKDGENRKILLDFLNQNSHSQFTTR